MSRRGRQLSWAIIVGATVFIAGYLLKHGETAYRNSEPVAPAAPRPPLVTAPGEAEPEAAEVKPETPTEETSAKTPEPQGKPEALPVTPAKPPAAPTETTPQPVAAQPKREPPPPPPAPKGTPRVKFEQPVFDFGTLYQEEKITHEYVFENVGQAPLSITKISASCGCTAVKPPQKETAPGEKGKIEVVFEAGKMRDRVTKHIYVTSNDPAEPRTTLTISGLIKVEAEVQPSGIYFGAIKVGETVTRSVVVKPAGVKEFKILEVKGSDPAIAVAAPVPAGKPEPEGSYRITLTVGPVPEARRITANLVIRTDLPHQKEIKVAVYGRVTAEQAALHLQPEVSHDPASAPQ